MKVATPKSIKAAKEWFKANPGRELTVSWAEHWTEADFYEWLRGCIAARINRHDTRTGRKFTSEYFWTMWRFSREINSRQVIHYIPALDDLRTRFAHRMYDEN